MDRGRISASTRDPVLLKWIGSHNAFVDDVNHGLSFGGGLT